MRDGEQGYKANRADVEGDHDKFPPDLVLVRQDREGYSRYDAENIDRDGK